MAFRKLQKLFTSEDMNYAALNSIRLVLLVLGTIR